MQNLKKHSPEKYQRVLEIKRELLRRQQSNRAKYFVPNGKSEQFIRMVGEGKTFVSMFIGANGTTKTGTGAMILTNIIFGKQSDWFDYPIFNKWPYEKSARIISDPTTIRDKIIPELKKWFPSNEAKNIPQANYETSKDGKNFEAKWRTNTGWEIDILSNEQDLTEFESADRSLIWADEPMPKDRFTATVARTRLGGIIMLTYTPLFHSGWLKDWIDEKMELNTGSDTYVDYIEAEVEDNCIEHGVRGILEHKNIERMVRAYDPDEYEARALGKFGHLIGKVHKRFSRKVHVIEPFTINERDFTVYMALDPHPRTPDHALWIAVDRKGTKFVCAELVSEGGADLLAERIRSVEDRHSFRIQDRIIDPSAYNDDQHHDRPSVGSLLHEKGLDFIKGSKDLPAGIKRTDDALAYELVNEEMIRAPEIYFFNICRTTNKQMEEYVWDEYKGRGADEKQAKPRPKDKDDHMPENLHRLLLHEPSFVRYDPQRGYVAKDSVGTFDPYDTE